MSHWEDNISGAPKLCFLACLNYCSMFKLAGINFRDHHTLQTSRDSAFHLNVAEKMVYPALKFQQKEDETTKNRKQFAIIQSGKGAFSKCLLMRC